MMSDRMKYGEILLKWYAKNHRPLPWRDSSDPYRIWISEIMLQQTTSTAVIPYFNRFIKRFPSVQKLAKSELEDVYEFWAGLGYYSRARNLHKTAKIVAKQGFPESYSGLIQLPGIGPYVSRAVSSFAFDENVGVLDGNVIRFLSRFYDLETQWWQSGPRKQLQKLADDFVKGHSAAELNQALIEIGATVCTAKNPSCLICPLAKNCLARKNQTIESRPLAKPKKKKEMLLWNAEIYQNKKRIKLIENSYAPFLKSLPIFPGTIRKTQVQPKKFDFCHSIMHYKIYVRVNKLKGAGPLGQWLPIDQIQRDTPSSLIKKTLGAAFS